MEKANDWSSKMFSWSICNFIFLCQNLETYTIRKVLVSSSNKSVLDYAQWMKWLKPWKSHLNQSSGITRWGRKNVLGYILPYPAAALLLVTFTSCSQQHAAAIQSWPLLGWMQQCSTKYMTLRRHSTAKVKTEIRGCQGQTTEQPILIWMKNFYK